MSTKHNALTEEDIQRFSMSPQLLDHIREHTRQLDRTAPPHILDWGCGRGRSVALLRQEGFEAFGVDIDRAVLRNGHDLFRTRGLDPERLLRHISDIGTFGDGELDIIFSEETIEHVANLEVVARESYRLLRPDGLVAHSFPGKRQVVEPHLRIPLVHWLPQGAMRLAWLHACLFLGAGPLPPWPEVVDGDGKLLPRSGQAAAYARYLEDKVHYRSIDTIASIFRRAGFQVHHRNLSPPPAWTCLLPPAWRRDGFPAGNVLLLLRKPDIIPPCASTGSTS